MYPMCMRFLPKMRHAAVLLQGDELTVIYSDVGDTPERLKVSTIALSSQLWTKWAVPAGQELLMPEVEYEGSRLPLSSSIYGSQSNVHQLRDPAIYTEQTTDHVYLIYCVRGEGGIALAQLEKSSDCGDSHAADLNQERKER